MAKRKRLTPARLDDAPALSDSAPTGHRPSLAGSSRPPIADVAQDAATTAALMQVSQEMQSARDEGRLVQVLPLSAVAADHLMRDRQVVDADEMDVLVASLRARGQQTPIEVTETAPGRYGLISGWRRLMALREIAKTDPDKGKVLALIRTPASAAAAYEAMVTENEIRVGLSFYERAHIVHRAVEAGVYPNTRVALAGLFADVPRARRSKIRSFLTVVSELGGALRFPAAVTEKLGLDLARALETPNSGERFRNLLVLRLDEADPETAAAEQAVLKQTLKTEFSPLFPYAPVAAKPAPAAEPLPHGLSLKRSGARWVLTGDALADEALAARVLAALKALE